MSEYLDCLQETDTHASFNTFSILAFVAAALDRRVYLSWSRFPLWPNMYTVLYGPSGIGKGASTNVAMRIFIDFLATHSGTVKLFPGDVTNEFLIDTLAKRNKQGLPASFLLLTEEIGNMCGRQEYKAGLVDSLTYWWTCPEVGAGRGTRSWGEQPLSALYPNILTNATPDAFKEVRKDVIAGGFLPRFIVVSEDKRRTGIPWEWEYDVHVINALGARLQGSFTDIQAEIDTDEDRLPIRMIVPRETAVYERLNVLKAEMDTLINENPVDKERAWYARLLEQALRMTLLFQVIEGKDVRVMDLECLDQSINVLKEITPGVMEAYQRIGGNVYAEWQTVLLSVIRQREGIFYHILMTIAVQKLHIEHGVAEKIIGSLISSGLVKHELKEDRGGNERQYLSLGGKDVERT